MVGKTEFFGDPEPDMPPPSHKPDNPDIEIINIPEENLEALEKKFKSLQMKIQAEAIKYIKADKTLQAEIKRILPTPSSDDSPETASHESQLLNELIAN